ncbi:MAG: ABC transporter substrate-binding protein [Nitrososphaerota archaeon]|nr:ABC transporter substrate-binding protein [Nitrososphaerota archaeon]
MKHRSVSMAVVAVVIVVVIIVAAVGIYYATRPSSPSSSGAALPDTTSFSFGVVSDDHPDLFGFAYMRMNNYTSSYVPNMKIEQFPGGSGDVLKALVSGSIQMGIAATDSAIPALVSGAPITIVAAYRSPNDRAYYVAANSSYTALSQLYGKTFADSKPGSLDEVTNHLLASDMGWTFASAIHETFVGSFQAQVASVLTGTAATSNGNPFDVYPLVAQGKLRVIGYINETWPGFVVLASTTFLKSSPNAVKATLEMLWKADAAFNANTNSATVNFLINRENFTQAEANLFMSLISYSTNGEIVTSQLQNAINVLYTANAITGNKTTITPGSLYTPGYAPVG